MKAFRMFRAQHQYKQICYASVRFASRQFPFILNGSAKPLRMQYSFGR